ncbi:MAG: LPS assembly protein LptD [Maricaulaceae bacterium]
MSAFLLNGLSLPTLASAQATLQNTATGTTRALDLAENSPFRDPNIIYLDADELINDEEGQVITVKGDVEGRYQDRTLRADKVVYNLDTGRVVALGNVVLIDADGSVQYAEKLELSNELEAGTATDFTARLANGGITGAALATRTSEDEIELYNAYYTACEPCLENGETKRPTWQLKARKVRQDKSKNAIIYNNAVFELLGIPVFYTPYLAHPDPSVDRASGWLNPFVGLSGSRGVETITPYYWAIDDHSELTLSPRIFTKVNPLLEYRYRRKFYSGEINIEGSAAYGSIFDNDGQNFNDPTLFTNPEEAPLGRRLRSHTFANAAFNINENWNWGAGFQAATDDFHLDIYDLDERPDKFGLYEASSRRLISQAFLIGQGENFRFSTSTYGFQDLRSSILENDDGTFTANNIDDGTLPIVAPQVQAEYHIKDPIVGGNLKASGDFTMLTRQVGTDYTRGSAGLEWSRNFIAPGGVEVKPFGFARYDIFDFEAENDDGSAIDVDSFSRELGQVGVDIRYPFIKHGNGVNFIIEPRVQITESFGDGRQEDFTIINNDGDEISLIQDGFDVDFDHTLLFANNKSTGFDFWREGFRADAGASFIADWNHSRAKLFVGQSYADNVATEEDFELGSGLNGDTSDLVGLFELDLHGRLKSTTRLRYDDDDNALRRIDSSLSYSGERISLSGRYFRVDSATRLLSSDPDAPEEEIQGVATVNLTDNWSVRGGLTYDLDGNSVRRQIYGLIYDDDCTRIEFNYNATNLTNDVTRGSSGFSIKVSLLSLGDFGQN